MKRAQLAEDKADNLEQRLIELMQLAKAAQEQHALEVQQLQAQIKVLHQQCYRAFVS